jgi:hypothetical protein
MTNFSLDFIGIGTPKAGTTWIYECLKEHPAVCLSEIKELDFFNRIQMFWRPDLAGFSFYDKGFEWYQSHFATCPPESTKGEISPIYFFDPEAPKKIHGFNPNIKLILSLRHPVKRLFSHYLYTKEKNYYPVPATFEEVVDTQPEFIDEGLYFKHLQNWLQYFPKEQILVLIYEDLFTDPTTFIKKIYRHVGIDETFIPPSLNENVNARDSKFIHNQVAPITNVIKKIPGGSILLAVGKKIRIDQQLKNWLSGYYKKTSKKVTLDKSTNDRLMKRYETDLRQLSAYLNRDLTKEWR